MSKFRTFIKKTFSGKWTLPIFILILVFFVFTRFSFIETKTSFGWDQVDNAWMAKNIIDDHNYPTVGMQAKGNTGFYIGPYYYYLITPFYLLTNLDPIASGVIAGITALLNFFLIYLLVRKILNEHVALIAVFINTFSFFVLASERTQWPVNFIAPVSLIIFFSLFKTIIGNSKYILLLVAAIGFSLHIHFTSIFYFLIVILSIPLMRKSKNKLRYILLSIPIAVFFVFPIAYSTLTLQKGNAVSYLESSYIGIHLRRFSQVFFDGMIEFQEIIGLGIMRYLGIIFFAWYLFLLYRDKFVKERHSIFFLSIIWIVVPWFAFSTYGGEISNYYFSMTRPVVLIVFSYLIYRLFCFREKIFLILPIIAGVIFVYNGLGSFIKKENLGISYYRNLVKNKIKVADKVEYSQGDPESYFYYVYKERFDRK